MNAPARLGRDRLGEPQARLGGIAPALWPPADDRIAAIAGELGMTPQQLAGHIDDVFRLDAAAQERLLPLVQRIADTITHIVGERSRLAAA